MQEPKLVTEWNFQGTPAAWEAFRTSDAEMVLSAVSARAQDNYEIQVLGYELVDPEHKMVDLHSNFTIDGQGNR